MSASPAQPRRAQRFALFAIFFLVSALIFVGGSSAIIYLLFSQYSGVRNIWILFCGAPVLLGVFVLLTVFNLYLRVGRPLEQLFNAINAVEEGNLAVRVPEVKSDMFSDLIRRFNKMVGELERAEQQRRNLTADIAHELRTPLHIIQGNLEGIVDGVYPLTLEHINATLDESRLLTRLVNDLQTLSLAETGQLPLHPTRFELADLVTDLVTSFASPAASQGVALQANVAAAPQPITADYDRLNQVMSNLIANALRHTPPGGTISIETKSEAGAERRVRIQVKDTGSGIAAADLPFVFDRFWRGDKSRTGRTHSGLGLAIARQLIHAHGGTIEAQSALGQGTTFAIELPDNMMSFRSGASG
jgi:two-component system OmpR family sensor kinase/two-component system sensor histidine kinase BaeS